ncbi:Palmitoyltransferase PFA5 [Apiospora hydei]|uniref:Palmitoyltransferase n=1 Tax=Apiospora hydei TaxID=1337664 RepID=A0ABR1VGV2_9PEZI
MTFESTKAASRWVTRVIPVILAVAVGYATYVTVARVCVVRGDPLSFVLTLIVLLLVDFLIHDRQQNGSAVAVLVLYFLFMFLMVATYLRTIITINTDPGLVPLGPLAVSRRSNDGNDKSHRGDDLEGQPYFVTPDSNPDSPGLELFYTKDVFICETDGRPKWCSECCNWKPDRAHHSSELNRCVLRMDHYCPWAGGMVGENYPTAFKFFVQFTTYTACYCGIVLGAAGSTLKKQMSSGNGVDGFLVGALGLGGFFSLFTFMMTITSLRYVLLNMTNVDLLGSRTKVYQLAVRIPRGSEGTDSYHVINYPLERPGSSYSANQRNNNNNGTRARVNTPSMGHEARDALAIRTFAILRTEAGENPWDLGYWENWKEVMGTNIIDWLFPIRRSPCVKHDQTESFYRMGKIVDEVRARHGIAPDSADGPDGLEMR